MPQMNFSPGVAADSGTNNYGIYMILSILSLKNTNVPSTFPQKTNVPSNPSILQKCSFCALQAP